MAKKYDSQATIERILSVAAKLFLEKGFDNTSMRDIANMAGVSKGAIYHHFQSKDAIFKAVAMEQERQGKAAIEKWLSETSGCNGKERLISILEKNLDSQEAHYLDEAMAGRVKSPEFVLSYMQGCVNQDGALVSQIIKQGLDDGSLTTAFPDECGEVFLLLLNIWCDPALFHCSSEKLLTRLKFLQFMMKSIGVDVLRDELLEKTFQLLQKLYFKQ